MKPPAPGTDNVTITSAVGGVVNTTVYVSLAPSVIVNEVGVTVTPAASFSVTVTSTPSTVTAS